MNIKISLQATALEGPLALGVMTFASAVSLSGTDKLGGLNRNPHRTARDNTTARPEYRLDQHQFCSRRRLHHLIHVKQADDTLERFGARGCVRELRVTAQVIRHV